MSRIFRHLGVAALLAALGGCTSNPFIVEVTDCPAVAFVRYTNTVTRFAPGSQMRVEDVAYKAALSDLTVNCRDQGEGVTTEITFTITADRGPTADSTSISLPYFVTVLRDGEEMVGKRVFGATLSFARGGDRTRSRERIVQVIPTNDLANRYTYEVLIGFQLSDQEAAYNVRQ